MDRRRFLQALFAVPCLGVPMLVPTVVQQPERMVYGYDHGVRDASCLVECRVSGDGKMTVMRVLHGVEADAWVDIEDKLGRLASAALLGEGG